jgi:glycosyltransferase involved in cell wall biosynthesis
VVTDVNAVGAVRSIVNPRKLSAFGVPLQASYWVDRFASVDALRALSAFVQQHDRFDCVICETLFTACYGIALREHGLIGTSQPILLRAHNIEHRIQHHLAHEYNRSWFERRYRLHLAEGTKSYETWIFEHVDGVMTLSETDAEAVRVFAPHTAVRSIPPGVTLPDVREPSAPSHELCFLGSLDWLPNIDGLRWFVERVMPLIRAEVPDAVLHIGGRAPSYDVNALHDGSSVIVHGPVENATEFRRAHGINIVPLFSGSGVRIKILEAFAAQCPVVSTTLGAEGLPVTHNHHLLIADDVQPFARACIDVMYDGALAMRLGRAGRELVAASFSWQTAVASMVDFVGATSADPTM